MFASWRHASGQAAAASCAHAPSVCVYAKATVARKAHAKCDTNAWEERATPSQRKGSKSRMLPCTDMCYSLTPLPADAFAATLIHLVRSEATAWQRMADFTRTAIYYQIPVCLHTCLHSSAHIFNSVLRLGDATAHLDMLMALCRFVHRLHLTNLRSAREWQGVRPEAISDLPCGHRPE